MNENSGLSSVLEIGERWPVTKILWLPKPEEVYEPDSDLFATASDCLRLYQLKQSAETGHFARMHDQPIELINKSEFC